MFSTKIIVLFLFVVLKQCNGVIYYLNESQYDRMPPVTYLDNYTECLQQPRDVYCTAEFTLTSDGPSELLDMILEYSEQTTSHYNHSKLRYGVCVTQHCQRYIQNTKGVSTDSLERCLNDSMWRDYRLKTKVDNYNCYGLSDNNIPVDVSDIIIAIILLVIALLNVIGSVTDVECTSNNKEVISAWSCFSIRRNWSSLTSSSNHSDPRLQRLKVINGLRCIIVVGVMMVHCSWPFYLAAKNTHDIELSYKKLEQYVFINGMIALQTYLVISGFLLSYKMELHSEKHRLHWRMMPRAFLLRYFRLTPVYAVTIALLATWIKFIGPGPLWDASGNLVRAHCRSRWWQNLLYINNYTYNSQCNVVAWYMGVDMQVFILGLVTCVALGSGRRRTAVLTTLFIIGLVLPAVHTYLRDLDAIMILAPQETSMLLPTDPTFNETYKMGHANIASYVVGLTLGYLVYRLQKTNIDINKYKKYRYLYWSTVPLLLAILLSGRIFFRDVPRDSIYIRVLSAALVKPVFGILAAGLICGAIFRLENIFRTVLEWQLWTIPSRLSYCVYLIHMPYLRLYVSMSKTLFTFSSPNQLLLLLCLLVVSFLTAVPLYLFVEAPFVHLTKYWSTRRINGPATKDVYTNISQEKTENMDTHL